MMKAGKPVQAMRTKSLLISAFALGLACLLGGCCGGGESKAKCQSEVTFQGAKDSAGNALRYSGAGKSDDHALNNACWDYCRRTDPEFGARYAISVDAMRKKGVKIIPGKRDLHLFDKPLKAAFEKCIDRCKSNAKAGKKGLSAKTECGVTPVEPDYARKRREADKAAAKKARKKAKKKKSGPSKKP
jgi:hypothetical protein